MEENRGAVLRTEIGPLPVLLRRVVHLPKGVQQLLVTYLGGVEGNLHHLGVSRFDGAYVFVGRVSSVATAVSDGRVNDPSTAAEPRLNPPKASCAKRSDLGHTMLLSFKSVARIPLP